jgi:Predicted aminopeptidases
VKSLPTLALVFFCLACKGENATGSTGFDGAAAYKYAGAQVAFGPRVPGTPAAKAAGDWIIAQMKSRGAQVVVQSFDYKTAGGKVIPMRNILARYRPELTDRILYVTHWDSRPVSESAKTDAEKKLPVPGANDGASGVGMFVALGDLLKKNKPNVGLTFSSPTARTTASSDRRKWTFSSARNISPRISRRPDISPSTEFSGT